MPKEFQLTPKQVQHVNELASTFCDVMTRKYIQGAEEHGGDLQDMNPLQLCENALEEAIDQFVYLATLRRKLKNERT